MVFSVQQGQHGPLVVYKLQVPKAPNAEIRAVESPAAGTSASGQAANPPRLRSGITRVPQQPATRSAATPQAVAPATQPVPSRAPRSLGTVVMPASALPPPQVVPVPVTPVPAAVTPVEAPAPAAEPLPAETSAAVPASLQPRVLGTVALSEIESLTDGAPVPLMPGSQDVFHVVEDSGFGTAMINEETGDSLTLQEVNDAAVWRRDTAERLRQVPIAPRF